jgi:hypothetical protein
VNVIFVFCPVNVGVEILPEGVTLPVNLVTVPENVGAAANAAVAEVINVFCALVGTAQALQL